MSDPHKSIETVFNAAKALAPGEQKAFLDLACKENAGLRQEVERLLAAASAADGFFDANPPGLEDAGMTLADEMVREGPGTVIGRYKLLQHIGEGGMGVVYMAEQTEPVVRKVALKIIKLGMDTRAVIARFEAERQALAMMDHPNIAKVLDAGTTQTGRPYFAMELVRGVAITEYCDKNHLSARQRLELFIPVCQAIQHAHQKGIIHRDIKPSNVLVTLLDGRPLPMVIDFGIAKATNQRLTEKTLFTDFRQMIGTPAYMSPEQAEMSKLDVDTRTDIYSLGVLLYELLTGTPPFTTRELMESGYAAMQRMIAEKEPARPSTRLATMKESERTTVAANRRVEPSALSRLFRGDLDWIVMKCLEKDRQRRYETASALAMDLERHFANEAVAARPPSTAYRLQKLVRRNRLAFSAGTVALIALVVGLGVSTWAFSRERAARHRAVKAEQEQSQLRQKAEAEARKSEEVARFLKEMLQGVGPSVAQGRDTALLREILDETANRVGKDLKEQPEVEIDLRNTIGSVYRELGQTEKAQQMYQAALDLARKLPEQPRLELAASLDGLAMTSVTNHAQRESMVREALAIRQQLLGEHHPDVATSLHHLGTLLFWERKWQESDAAFQEALRLRGQLTSEHDPGQAAVLAGMGTLSMELQRPEAVNLYRSALVAARTTFGSDHPELALRLSELAHLLAFRGEFSEAESLQREAVAIGRKIYGNDHPKLAQSVSRLADTLWCQGKLEEAEGLSRESLVEYEAIYGPHDHRVVYARERLELLLSSQAKTAAADALRPKAVELEKVLSEGNLLSLGDAYWRLTLKLQAGGRYADAEVIGRHGIELLQQTSPNEERDSTLAGLLRLLGRGEMSRGKVLEAENSFRKALALRRPLAVEERQRTRTAEILVDLSDVVLQRGEYVEAESLCREGIALLKNAVETSAADVQLARLCIRLGNSLRHQGRLADAETAQREGLELCKKASPDDWELRQWAAGDLGALLKSQGRFAEAEDFYREAVTNSAKRWPKDFARWEWQVKDLADVLRRQGKTSEAEALRAQWPSRDASTPAEQPGRASTQADQFGRSGQWEAALTQLKRLIESDPSDGPADLQVPGLLIETGACCASWAVTRTLTFSASVIR